MSSHHISATTDVRDDRDTGRFVLEQDGMTAQLGYRAEGRLVLTRTQVPLSLDRHGTGGRLLLAAVARARVEQLTLVPSCSFARRWLRDNAEAADGVAIDWTEPAAIA